MISSEKIREVDQILETEGMGAIGIGGGIGVFESQTIEGNGKNGS